MEVIIYGKSGCVNCEKTRMLCQIQSITYRYLAVDSDISVAQLQAKVGQPVRTLPQIFVEDAAGTSYVGGYEELRAHLRARQQEAQAA